MGNDVKFNVKLIAGERAYYLFDPSLSLFTAAPGIAVGQHKNQIKKLDEPTALSMLRKVKDPPPEGVALL